jgi:ubiquinone/menaquinone biosynthesis C-methylase UbiE
MSTITGAIQEQFGHVAENYRTSAVHAAGQDLEAIIELARTVPTPTVLDMGCGAGHVTVGVAPWSTKVVACDLTAAMLDQVWMLAGERGVTNIETKQADASHLPFDDASFDIVVSRLSAHHWTDLPAAMAECRRLLKPSGHFIMGDVVAPENPAFDTFLQTIEYLRDRSHVRDYSISQWRAMFEQIGMEARIVGTWPLPLNFESWVTRMATPTPQVEILRHLLRTAAAEISEHFVIQDDTEFTLECAVLHGIR